MHLNSHKAVSPLTVLWCGAFIMTISLGIRHSFGLFLQPMSLSNEWGREVFAFSIAMQNLVWGLAQPFVGRMADRLGSAVTMILGGALYTLGLFLMAMAESPGMLTLSAGVLIGLGLSGTTFPVVFGAVSRAMPPEKRSMAMGSVSALGSLGLTLASPMAQHLISTSGWQTALIGFLALAAVMVPAAFMAGRSDQIEVPAPLGAQQTVTEAIREALGHRGYMVLAIAFFVCGLQLVFITTHLPAYLDICGMDPSVGSTALALVGLFNVIGSYLFGWLGGKYSKRMLLGGIYVLRSIFIAVYFLTPPTPTSTLVFAAAMGTLWLGVVPLVSGLVIHLFGLRYMATLSGVAFFSHQVGSFIGAWGGGLIYNRLGNYDLAWQGAVAIGLAAGLFQMTMNVKPSARILAERSATVGA